MQVKRKYPRRALIQVVGVLHHGIYQMAKSNVIGEGGLSVNADGSPKVGDELVVNFQIPTGDFVSIRSEVRSVTREGDHYELGLLFKNIAFSNKRQIRAFVSARSESEDSMLAS